MSKDTLSRFIEAVPQDQADALLVSLVSEKLEGSLNRDRDSKHDYSTELLTAIEGGNLDEVLRCASFMWMQKELFGKN